MISSFIKKMVRWWQRNDLNRSTWALVFLFPLSLVYALGQKIHFSLQKAKKSSLFIISVGSICSGGSGKTPFCAWLYDKLQESRKSLILMRGYKSKKSGLEWVRTESSGFIADEAWMLSGLHQNLNPTRAVMMAPNRFLGAQKAFEEGFELAILDDGMQHYALIRDLELTILDPDDLLQGLLPLGRRREPWNALKRADWILFRSANPIDLFLRKKLNIESKPYARFSYVISGWRNNHFLYQDCSFLTKSHLGLCSGVARPQKVIDLLKDEGIYPTETLLLADHENLEYEALCSLEIKWKEKGLSYAICTEKDYARWSQKSPLSDFWIYPELSLNWHEGEKELLDGIKQRLSL